MPVKNCKPLKSKRGRRPGTPNLPATANYIIWADHIAHVPSSETARRLGVTVQAIDQRKLNLRSLIDPTGERMAEWRGGINALLPQCLAAIERGLKNDQTGEFGLKVMASIGAIKENAQASGGFNLNQFFGNGAANGTDDKSGVRANIAATYRF